MAELKADLERHGIDAAWEEHGLLSVATQPHELDGLEEEAALLRRFGWEADVLGRDEVRAAVASPTYLGAVHQRTGVGLVDPGALALGLRRAALALGVRLHERTPVTEAAPGALTTPGGSLRAPRILLATGAYPPLTRAIRRLVAPVYDYALVTEPLSAAQRRELRWEGREGIADRGNRFHYYRLTPDDRVLFGGYEAIYHFGNRRRSAARPRPAHVRTAARAPARHVPGARGDRHHPRLGRPDRHLQPLLRDVRARAGRHRGLRGRLHRPRRGGDAGSAPARRSTCSTAPTPSARGSSSSGGGRCRSRPSRRAGR